MNSPNDILNRFGTEAVLRVLRQLEIRGVHDLSTAEAMIADELIGSSLVRATVLSRFVLADGTLRLRVNSDGLTVAGTWTKQRIESGALST